MAGFWGSIVKILLIICKSSFIIEVKVVVIVLMVLFYRLENRFNFYVKEVNVGGMYYGIEK